MRILADENFPKPIVEALRVEGHDVLWARTDYAGARDLVLLDLAEAEARIVLTLDKDFWHIAVQTSKSIEPIRGCSVPRSSGDDRESGTACTCVHRGGCCVDRTYQHHHSGRNSNGRSAQKVNRFSVVFSQSDRRLCAGEVLPISPGSKGHFITVVILNRLQVERFPVQRESVIVSDPEILGGTPCFRGTRVPVDSLIDYLEAGDSLNEFLDNFPSVSREAAIAALEKAKRLLTSPQ